MLERRSTSHEFRPPLRPATVGVHVEEPRFASIAQVTAWPDTADEAAAAIRDAIGSPPDRPGRFTVSGGATIAALAPGRTLVLSDEDGLAARLESALPASVAAVTDLDGARALLRLRGAAVSDLLSRGVSIDLDPRIFPPGALAQTVVGHLDALLLRREIDIFDLAVIRSFGLALTEWVADAGAEFGIAFGR